MSRGLALIDVDYSALEQRIVSHAGTPITIDRMKRALTSKGTNTSTDEAQE